MSHRAPRSTRIAHALGPIPCAAAGVLLTAPSTARADVGRSARAWALRDRTAIAQRRVPRCGSPDRAAGAFSAPAARCRRSTWRSAVRPPGRSGTGWRWPQGLPSVGRGSCAALRPAARDLFSVDIRCLPPPGSCYRWGVKSAKVTEWCFFDSESHINNVLFRQHVLLLRFNSSASGWKCLYHPVNMDHI